MTTTTKIRSGAGRPPAPARTEDGRLIVAVCDASEENITSLAARLGVGKSVLSRANGPRPLPPDRRAELERMRAAPGGFGLTDAEGAALVSLAEGAAVLLPEESIAALRRAGLLSAEGAITATGRRRARSLTKGATKGDAKAEP